MSFGPRATVDDRPPETPEDRLGDVSGSAMSPAEPESPEPPPLVLERDHFVAHVDVALRVVSLVVLAVFIGMAGWLVASAWSQHSDERAGGMSFLWIILTLAAFCHVIWRMWRSARQGVGPALDATEIAKVESRALLEAVERHDRLLEAQRVAAVKPDDVVNAEPRPEARDPRGSPT